MLGRLLADVAKCLDYHVPRLHPLGIKRLVVYYEHKKPGLPFNLKVIWRFE